MLDLKRKITKVQSIATTSGRVNNGSLPGGFSLQWSFGLVIIARGKQQICYENVTRGRLV